MVTQRADSLARRPARCCLRRHDESFLEAFWQLLAHAREVSPSFLLDFLGNRRESFFPQCGPEQTHTDPTCRFFWAFSILLVWLYRRGLGRPPVRHPQSVLTAKLTF